MVIKEAKGGSRFPWVKDWVAIDAEVPKSVVCSMIIYWPNCRLKSQQWLEAQEYETVTFIWMQGERDAKEGDGAIYQASLAKLIAQLEQDLGRTDINFIGGRLGDFRIAIKWPIGQLCIGLKWILPRNIKRKTRPLD